MSQMHCLRKRFDANLLKMLVMGMHIWLAVHSSKEAVTSIRTEAKVESNMLVVQATTGTQVESEVPNMLSVIIAIREAITRRIFAVS